MSIEAWKWIGEALEDRLTPKRESAPRPGSTHTRGSEIGGCKRRTAYRLRMVEQRPVLPKHWFLLFQGGHLWHGWLQDVVKSLLGGDIIGVQIEPRVPKEFQDTFRISGRGDVLFTRRDGEKLLLEIKTLTSKEYGLLEYPSERHLDQTTVYQAALGASTAWLLYCNRETGAHTAAVPPYLREFDAARWAAIRERIETCAQDPWPEPEPGSDCDFCDFAWKCPARGAP